MKSSGLGRGALHKDVVCALKKDGSQSLRSGGQLRVVSSVTLWKSNARRENDDDARMYMQ